ncbi:MASE1 domain-containing protein [Xanthomonas arboricola]|uniref:MASE1 domain-containing protein n=1 Tax=Xanthomonas arboricola TaxID=56448 RepID=UPI00063E76B1|nr:MASE1 domain-containing protein [Xanthomonas arboricola]PPU46499.1 histidine kinase [Xanthomonas arboricola]CAD7380586.1 MASE1 domain-containing protein [Xanthomonas arboricola]
MAVAKELVRGMLISVCYCLVSLILWRFSIDQWYLPVGLRVVTLLFRPYREWPFLLAGDAAAMLVLRIPLGELQGFNPLWAYLSPFLHVPLIASGVFLLRYHVPNIVKKQHWLIPAALALGLWNAVCSMLLNETLGGPPIYPVIDLLLLYCSGSYLGILILLLPTMLWTSWNDGPVHSSLPRDLAVAVVFILGLFFSLGVWSNPSIRNILMIAMLVPMIVMTFRHGWKGIALGSLLASFGLEFSLPRVYQAGFFDQHVFNIQLLYGVMTTALFIFNARLRESARNNVSNRAKDDTFLFARASYSSAERLLRNRVLEYSDINVQINRMRKDVVADLRAKGQHAVAMEMTRVGVLESQLLQQYVAALYPLEIETHGLYQALRSPALERFCQSRFQHVFRGDCKNLSLELQLSAYRSVLNCVEILPSASRHFIQARAWTGKGARGVAVRVIADSSSAEPAGRYSDDVEAELDARLKAHGGMLRRRHALVVTFLVAEPDSVEVRGRLSTGPQLLHAGLVP